MQLALPAAVERREQMVLRTGELSIVVETMPDEIDSRKGDGFGDPAPEAPLANRRRLRIAEGSFEQSVFGQATNSAGARTRLDAILRQKVDAIDRICGLTDVQKQKLQLAGRGDVQRLFERVEDLRPKFQQTKALPDGNIGAGLFGAMDVNEIVKWAQELSKEAQPLRIVIEAGPFDDGSLFAKTLRKQLTPDQAAQYDRRFPNISDGRLPRLLDGTIGAGFKPAEAKSSPRPAPPRRIAE
jgi:hypothetical protein